MASPSSPLPADVETVTRDPAQHVPALDDIEPEPPRTLGRYAIIGELGAGGMGRVLRAHDPELDREVAIKLLRRVDEEARLRLRREAQAMAQLAHPNVLPIYDVADDGPVVFIAMELVRGRSMRDWLKEGPRPWSTVLEVLAPAGRGLAAAHEAGLVHRDFKPANVLLGEDGRVRVMDFGLARFAIGSDEGSGGRRSSGSWSGASDDGASGSDPRGTDTRSIRVSDEHDVLPSPSGPLTGAGTVLGTPAYMAPEQHVGQTVDHRCDQYAFCVTLWEALYGRRPFKAKALAGWHRAKTTSTPKADPERKVPRWLHAAVLRGLAPLPGDRFPSMAALLSALAQGAGRHRRRRTLGLALGGVVLVGGLGAVLHDPRRMCTGAEDKLADIWDGKAAAEVEASMLATDVGYAADTWARVAPQLDGYAARWQLAHEDACEATHVRHEQPEAIMDARMRCLEDRRRALRALVHTLRAADAKTVERAVSVVGTLPTIEPCADADYVQAQALPPADPRQAAEANALGEELARIKALLDAGRPKQVEHDARAAVERAQALGHAPLEAQARFRLGVLEHNLGRYEASVAELEQAYFIAQHEHLDTLQAEAATQLVGVLGVHLGLPERAEPWTRHAEGALERALYPTIEASFLGIVGMLAMERGDHSEAIALQERALALYERQHGPDHPHVAIMLSNLAVVHARMERFDQAEVLLERSLDIRERLLAPMHPQVGASLLNLANIDLDQGHPERAHERLVRALAIYEAAFGREHPEVGGALLNLGNVHEELGEPRRALAAYQEALPIIEATQGADHLNVVGTLVNMGVVHHALGEPAEALERFERALRSFERTQDHPVLHATALAHMAAIAADAEDLPRAEAQCLRGLEVLGASASERDLGRASLQTTLGLVRTKQGRHEDALRLHREALATRRELLGPRHPDTAISLLQLGTALVHAGKPSEAIEPLEEAIAIHGAADGGAVAKPEERVEELHEARFRLAQARWDAGVEREEAVAMAREARVGLRGESGATRTLAHEMDAWLAERGTSKAAIAAHRSSPR